MSRPIHRRGAGVALFGLAALGAGLVFVERLEPLLAGFAAALVGFFLVERFGWPSIRRLCRGLALVAALAVVQGLGEDPAVGLALFLRFATLVCCAHVVTGLWSWSEICEALIAGLRPFERFGLVDAERCAFTLMLALRFVPDLVAEFDRIREAQAMRGGRRSIVAVAAPLGVRALLRAEEVADAVALRAVRPYRAAATRFHSPTRESRS